MFFGEISLAPWVSLFQSTASVAATLCGFVAVALSVNLKSILASPHLITRSGEVLVRQLATLMISLLMLVPDHWFLCRAVCILILGVGFWILTTILDWHAMPPAHLVSRRRSSAYFMMGQVISLSLIAGAAAMAMGNANAPVWMTVGVLASFILALVGAWVLLIEIMR